MSLFILPLGTKAADDEDSLFRGGRALPSYDAPGKVLSNRDPLGKVARLERETDMLQVVPSGEGSHRVQRRVVGLAAGEDVGGESVSVEETWCGSSDSDAILLQRPDARGHEAGRVGAAGE